MSEPQTAMSIYEEAAAWVLRTSEDGADPDLSAALAAWRARSPEHDRAFAAASGTWDLLGEQATSPELLARRRDALHRARAVGRRRWLETRLDRRALAAGIAAAVAVPAAGITWLRLRPPTQQVYATGRGEQRAILLADGSRLSMDALTRVTVAYSRDLRAIELETGRVNLEVAKDPERPLRVRAGGPTVTALGTVFTVERAPRSVVVTLVEGSVAVGRKPRRTLRLGPGQELTLAQDGRATLREHIDTEQAMAWRDGKLIFDDEPLSAAASRMNNYGSRQIVVEGGAQALRVSGVFRAGDVEAFVGAVESYFPLDATWDATTVVLRPRAPTVTRAPV